MVNGFDRLEQAIARLIERLPESTLEDKFALVSQWIESYHVDVVPRRLGEQLSLLLGTALTSPRATQSRRTGVKQILVTSFALHQLLLVLTRLKPILAPVIDTVSESIFGSIYIDPIVNFPREIIDVNLDRDTLVEQMKCFQQRTYFQECRDNERRLASVRDFMIDRDKVRQRQLNVLRSVMTSTGAYSVGLCFRAWRGYVHTVSNEKKKDSELVRVLDERADLRTRVSQLEDKLTESTDEVERLTAANAHLTQRVRDATDANRYDALGFSEKIASLELALAEATCLLEQRDQTIENLQKEIATLQQAAETEVASLRAGFLNSTGPRIAREAWMAANGLATIVSETSASAWCYELARRALTEQGQQLGALVDIASLSELAACPKPITTTTATFDIVLLGLSYLMPKRLPADRLAELLKSSRLVDKVCGLVQWTKEAKVPVGICAVEQLLLDANPSGIRSLVGQIVSFAMSNEKCAEVYSPTESVLSPVFNSAWQDIAFVSSVAAVQLSAVDYAARCAVGINREVLTRLEKPLSPHEQADRALFSVSGADLRPEVSDDNVPAVQQVVRLYYPLIRHLFRAFSGIETAGSSGIMSEFAFTRLVKDARVAQAGAVDVAFIRGMVGEGLSAKRFVSALVQIAIAKFAKMDPAAALVSLLLRMRSLAVAPNAESVHAVLDADETFVSVTSDLRPDLLKIFRKYCTEGIANRMGVGEFVKLMQDVKALDDAALTNAEVREMFAATGPANGTISFDGFIQLNCLVGLVKVRMPWATATARASRFLHDVLISPLQRKLALQTPGIL